MAEENSVFELPFQWDDGNFLSPYVASEADGLADLVKVLSDPTMSGRWLDEAGNGAEPPVFSDLGCGNGCVVHHVIRTFPSVRGIGFDLDDNLIEVAQKRLAQEPDEGVRSRIKFHVADLRDELPSVMRMSSVAFFYLLPDALELLQEHVEAGTAHWKPVEVAASSSPSVNNNDRITPATSRLRCVVSHRWPIPYLSRFLLPRDSDAPMHVYVDGATFEPPSSAA